MASVPGPAPISRTLDFGVISVSQTVWSILLLSCRHISQKRRALSRLSQVRAQSLPGLDSRFAVIWLIQTSFQSISFCGSIMIVTLFIWACWGGGHNCFCIQLPWGWQTAFHFFHSLCKGALPSQSPFPPPLRRTDRPLPDALPFPR